MAELNDIMEFDHVIEVRDDGSIISRPDLTAPSLWDNQLDSPSEWELLDGYSGQDRYSGPIMHDSEFIAGGMERDIRDTPGVYVAVISQYSDMLCIHCKEQIHEAGSGADGIEGFKHVAENIAYDHEAELLDETLVEGWAVARRK